MEVFQIERKEAEGAGERPFRERDSERAGRRAQIAEENAVLADGGEVEGEGILLHAQPADVP